MYSSRRIQLIDQDSSQEPILQTPRAPLVSSCLEDQRLFLGFPVTLALLQQTYFGVSSVPAAWFCYFVVP